MDNTNNIIGSNLLIKIKENWSNFIFDKLNDEKAWLTDLRKESMGRFEKTGFPPPNDEAWRGTSLEKNLSYDYKVLHDKINPDFDLQSVFQCDVPHFEAMLIAKVNGWMMPSKVSLEKHKFVACSLNEAFEKYPELIEKHFNKVRRKEDSLNELNTAFFQDGAFVYIPDNTVIDDNIQLVDIVDSEESLFLNTRNLIIVGKNSYIKLVQCEDSINRQPTFINSLTEIVMLENSTIDYYRLQNKDENTALLNNVFVEQAANTQFNTVNIILNGGMVRNNITANLTGQNANTDISGLYLNDHEQHVDNRVLVNHLAPNCNSNQLYKGILDDQATGVFNGLIYVEHDASGTNAMQSNKNILLTEKASIETKPFLEIFNDDVKCSHGATVGQLDSEAMFYIRSRGISEHNANVILMYAFAEEVIRKIKIPALQLNIDDVVKKRLRGENIQCNQCVLNCSQHEKDSVHFDIDISKI